MTVAQLIEALHQYPAHHTIVIDAGGLDEDSGRKPAGIVRAGLDINSPAVVIAS